MVFLLLRGGVDVGDELVVPFAVVVLCSSLLLRTNVLYLRLL